MEDEKPDTSHLVLKPKVVDPIDKIARPGDGTAISVQGIHRENVRADEQRAARRKPSLAGEAPKDATAPPGFKFKAPPGATVPLGFKRKEVVPVSPTAPADDAAGIRVLDILAENLDAEEASGWGQLKKQPKRRKRRTRDFLLIVGTIDLGVGVMIKVADNPMVMVYGLAAIALVTSTLGWIMFFVMDSY